MVNPNLNSMLGPHIVICSQIVPKLVLNGDFKHCIIVFIATVLFGICVPFLNAFICDLFSVSSYLCFFQSASTYQCTYTCWSVTVLCSNLYPLYVDVTLFTLFYLLPRIYYAYACLWQNFHCTCAHIKVTCIPLPNGKHSVIFHFVIFLNSALFK